jgi:hypothetical protein
MLGSMGTGSFIGNSGYQNSLNSINVYNVDAKDTQGQSLVQSIPLTPTSGEFLGVLPKPSGATLGIDANPAYFGMRDNSQLQLETFVPIQQKRVRTTDAHTAQAQPSIDINQLVTAFGGSRNNCQSSLGQTGGGGASEECMFCPIYVYSAKPERVTVKPVTAVYAETAVPALSNNSWSFVADKLGNLLFPDNSMYGRIDFLFPKAAMTIPTRGRVLSKGAYAEGLKSYAEALGLRGEEVTDVVNHFLPEIADSNYVFLSHLSDADTKRALDIDVTPQPSGKTTRLFYLKKLSTRPATLPQEPVFTPLSREGDLTVVTWGGIVE